MLAFVDLVAPGDGEAAECGVLQFVHSETKPGEMVAQPAAHERFHAPYKLPE